MTTQGWVSEQLHGWQACRWGEPGPREWGCKPGYHFPTEEGAGFHAAPPPLSGMFSLQLPGRLPQPCTLCLPCAADLPRSFADACHQKEVSASGIALKRPFSSSWELYLHLGIVAGSPVFWQLRRARICHWVPLPIFLSTPCSLGNVSLTAYYKCIMKTIINDKKNQTQVKLLTW